MRRAGGRRGRARCHCEEPNTAEHGGQDEGEAEHLPFHEPAPDTSTDLVISGPALHREHSKELSGKVTCLPNS